MTPEEERLAKHLIERVKGHTSCVGCKFMYYADTGYSNYTVTDTIVDCSLDRNPNLPADMPSDWNGDVKADNWPKTNNSRCERWGWFHGRHVHFPVEEETIYADGKHAPDPECIEIATDAEAAEAISKHYGRLVKSMD